jgi:hypothetical protein
MIYTTVRNLQWDHNHLTVNCIVNFARLGELPFTANPNDDEEHGREIYARCIAGDFGPIADYVPQPDEGPQEPSEFPPDMQIPITTPGTVL